MEKRKETIGGHECLIYDCGSADTLLIQLVDDHDLEVIDNEVAEIVNLSGGKSFTLATFKVNDWNDDLSPWEAPAVFGEHGFGGKASATLEFVRDTLITKLTGGRDVRLYIGGYSLAAFFALWAAYQTDEFAGVAAASPSVWFPGWIEFAENSPVKAGKVYLSLGDKEEKTRNPVMRTVGDNIRRMQELLAADPAVESTLEMNQGNHFRDADIRTAKGFAWLLSR